MLRNSSTYIYLALALGLVCYVFIDKKTPGTKAREEAETQLYQLNPDEVTGLEITNVHGVFIFQKLNGHWEIKKPVDTPADGGAVDSIINQIAFTQPQRLLQIDGGADKDMANLKDWGLNPPAERVVIHTKTKHYELLVGRKIAINDSVYARASGRRNEPVRILPNLVKDVLQKDLSALRSRSVFDFDPEKVTKAATRVADTASSPGQQSEIDLKDGKWTLQLPLVARASETEVQTLLSKILGLRAVDFVVDDASNLSAYGLTSPASTLTLAVKNDKGSASDDMVLQIGGPVPNKPDQVYAQRLKSSSVFTLTKASIDDVMSALPKVRDRHVLPFDPNKPTALSYAIGPRKAQVKSDHALWNCVGQNAGPADVNKILELLAKLSQLQTTPLVKDSATDLKLYGLDQPSGKITVDSPDFKPGPAMTLIIGKTENKLVYVRNSAEPFIYTLADNALDFLPASNLALRDPRAINLKREKVKSITVIAASGSSVSLARSEGGTWSASTAKDRMVDTNRAETQSALLCQLQAKAWLGPVLPNYGLSKPVLTISILTDEPKPTVLRIGQVLPDGTHAAQIEGDPTAFALSDADYGLLNASSLQLVPKELGTNAPSATPPVPVLPSPPAPAPISK